MIGFDRPFWTVYAFNILAALSRERRNFVRGFSMGRAVGLMRLTIDEVDGLFRRIALRELAMVRMVGTVSNAKSELEGEVEGDEADRDRDGDRERDLDRRNRTMCCAPDLVGRACLFVAVGRDGVSVAFDSIVRRFGLIPNANSVLDGYFGLAGDATFPARAPRNRTNSR